MKITLKLWGQLKQAAGSSAIIVEAEEGSTVEALVYEAAKQNPGKLAELMVNSEETVRKSNLVFVHGAQQDWSFEVSDGMEITLMSPIAGG